MMQKDAKRPHSSQLARRLLLALSIMFGPLLANSHGMPATVNAAGDASNHEMPCHPAGVEAAKQGACPHCAIGDGAAAECHCCGYAAPAGVSFQAGTFVDSFTDSTPLYITASDPLPESSGDRLYRPPISHG